ncbi:acyltransferase family protein [Lutibacter holmesii]|uniref:Acyltransferase family protein n=1 Tax=Lutibacter holmesii TaxID=1137985 RepID=A0ABW3WNF7_9FLAO
MHKNKFEKLEALRGFAALYVVLFHTFPQQINLLGINVGVLFRFGSEAVIVFFVLSGFVIKYSFEKSNDKSFKNYFKRRFIRLYIPLIFIFILGYLIKSYSEGALANPEWSYLLSNLFMLQDVISQKPNVIAPPYMGNGVLWSLSYEWWFYMFFFIATVYINNKNLNKWINITVIISAISYLFYPFIVNRIVMYFAIWWTGARFADLYLKGNSITYKAMLPYAAVLITVTLILALNFYLNFNYTKIYSYPLVAFPFIELRHFVFTIMLLFTAITWKNLNWFGFNTLFGVFKYLAPCSYVIYISHHYLVVKATYLNFINNTIIEYGLYIILMILFSYLIEAIIYERIKKYLFIKPINNNIP